MANETEQAFMLEPKDNLFAVAHTPEAPAGETYAFPASAAQRGQWLLDQLEPGNPACNIAVRFRLLGPLNPTLLEECLNAFVSRHESLRTRFSLEGGELFQIVEPELRLKIEVHDLRHRERAEREREADRLAAVEAQAPFNPAALPLIRVGLIRTGNEESILLATVHHAISDGWSVGIFVDELTSLYDAGVQGIAPRLPDLSIQFADFAIWQKEQIESGALDAQLSYWKARLAGAPRLEIPIDFARGPAQFFGSEIRSVLLGRDLTNRVQELSRRAECTLFVVLLSAFQVLMHRFSGQNDIVIGTLGAGRSRAELEPLVGVFVNSLVLRTDLSGDPRFMELLSRANQTVAEAFQNQDVPFDLVVRAVNPPRDERMHPLFQVNIIYQRDFVRPARFGGVEITAIPSKPAGTPYDLNFFLVERADGWRASIEFGRDLFREETVTGLLGDFEQVLREICERPEQRISELFSARGKTLRGVAEKPPVAADRQPGGSGEGEERVRRIWQRVLGVESIGNEEDFFEAGGHSLLATSLLADVNKELGASIRLADFLKAPTVARMAAAIAAPGKVDETAAVIPIHKQGSRPPLYLVHGVGGTVVGLGLLSKHLGKDQPLYAVQSPRLDGEETLPTTIEEMARRYVREILAIQPTGPYYLLGYSLGGLIAFEMAQQLRAQGQQVGMLGMLDTFQLGYWRKMSSSASAAKRVRELFRVVRLHLNRLAQGPDRFAYLVDRIGSKYATLLYRFRAEQGGAPRVGTVDHLNWYAGRKYEAKTYPDNIVLFRASDRDPDDDYDYLLGWGGLARGGLEVYDIPGSHEEMGREPHIQGLARAVEFCISKSIALSRLSLSFRSVDPTR